MKIEIEITDENTHICIENCCFDEELSRLTSAFASVIQDFSRNKRGYKSLKRACIKKLKSISYSEVTNNGK